MTDDKSQRQQSTIQFPYRDLESSIAVADAVWRAGAAVGIASDQLAQRLDINVGTGNFMTRIAAAKMFGLIATIGGKYALTELGYEIVESNEERRKAAKAAAFLNVPLYKKTFDTFRGKALPPRSGLEQTFVAWGVAPKQKENARLAFEKSARAAGYFNLDEDRLVPPIISATSSVTVAAPQSEEEPDVILTDRRTRSSEMHPFVQGLLLEIPKPGTQWPLAERVEWLRAAVHSFNLIYKTEGEIEIIGRPKQHAAAPSLAGSAPAGPPSLRQAEAAKAERQPIRRTKAELDDDIPF